MVRITFIDGDCIDIDDSVRLIGINNVPRGNSEDPFYLQQNYNDIAESGSALLTCDERLGYAGFILSHDCFALREGERETIYMRSAVKSISVV